MLVVFDHGPDTGDLEYENAWGVEHIGSREVHLAGNTGQGMKVAVIDTGIDYIHDDPDDEPYVVDPEFLQQLQGRRRLLQQRRRPDTTTTATARTSPASSPPSTTATS